MSKWPDGTRKSIDNVFNWNTGSPSLLAKVTMSDKVTQGRARAVAEGRAVPIGKAITIKRKKK